MIIFKLMRKKVLLPALLIVSFFLIGGVVLKNLRSDRNSNYLEIFGRAIYYIKNFYVESVNPAELIENAIRGMTKKASPVAGYVKGDLEQFRLRSVFFHPGIIIYPQLERMIVLRVVKGSDAYEKGLRRGDIITKIENVPTRLLSLWEANWLLYGKKGTDVSLKFFRRGEEKEVKVKRDFPIHDFYWRERDLLEIYRIFPETVVALKDSLKGKNKLIIDLRFFFDGDWKAAIELASLFIPNQEITLKTRNREFKKKIGSRVFSGRMILISDTNCIGACAIFSGILAASGVKLLGKDAKAGCGWLTVNLFENSFLIVPDSEIIINGHKLCRDGVKAIKVAEKEILKEARRKLEEKRI